MSYLSDLALRAELSVVRFLFGLSPSAKIFLSGGSPVVIDGQTLDPELQLLLRLRKLRGALPLHAGTPQEARLRMHHEAVRYWGERIQVQSVRDLTIPGAAGPIRARHYAPATEGRAPLLVYFHGGGFVTGDLDTHDAPCRLLCREGRMHVLAVDYRLAPEHPFPAGVDDAISAFRWACAHATELSADPTRVGVGGDSAGGNLSAVVSQVTARGSGPSPSFQLLIYPNTESRSVRPSTSLFSEGFLLTQADMFWYDGHYLGEQDSTRSDPRAAPLRARDLSGLCPALIVTAGFDPLRDEGEAYAAALSAAGTQVTLRRLEGFIHGFINMIGVSPVAHAALAEIGQATATLAATTASKAA